MCGTGSLHNQTGKRVKNTEENKTSRQESVLKSWRSVGGENRRDTGECGAKPGWVLRGKPDLHKNGQGPSTQCTQRHGLVAVTLHGAMIT